MEFFATCGTRLEKALGQELKAAGVRGVRPLSGGVSFRGHVIDAYKALLWSRIASRVLLNVARVPAANADELYENVKEIAWEEHIGEGKTIVVDARGITDELRNTQFTAMRVKDAICDRLRELRGFRPDVSVHNPDVRINVVVNRNKATISIDLSGKPLDQRGYRPTNMHPQGAPIRENLAAAMLTMADWPNRCLDGSGLLNTECGDGIIAVEAALIAGDVAPGLWRTKWGFEGWLGHDQEQWDALIEEADARAEAARVGMPPIIATDTNEAALDYARACAKHAGISDCITFCNPAEAPALSSKTASTNGVLICNISGAEQFNSYAQMPAFYASMRAAALDDPAISELAMLAADESAEAMMGIGATTTIEVRNGANEAVVNIFDLEGVEAPEMAEIVVRDQKVSVNDINVEQFAARLGKMAKQRRKWAKREGISAYRVYDADLPDYNLAIDIYNGAGGDAGRTLIHVAEYAAPKKIEPAKALRRFNDALCVIPLVLDVDPTDVYVKRRIRAKGGSQYADGAAMDEAKRDTFITQENGLLFEVDLHDRLDTGLFLDHRDTRMLLSKLVPGKSFLNLFAYTGTASVYAAAAGAKFTTTVDLSNTYQEWTRRNFELNGFAHDCREMEMERADAQRWVNEKRHSRERWDLIFVDPPTFSNSAKMGTRTWDVQDDHAELLIGCSRLLTRQGVIMFSCNLRNFKLDAEKLARAGVVAVDITDKTIPADFARHKKIHHCYLLRRS